MESEQKTREVDLAQVFMAIGRSIHNFFINIAKTIFWLIRFGLDRWRLMIVFSVVGLLWGAGSFFDQAMYQSNMVIRTNSARSYEMKDMINNLSAYFESTVPTVKHDLATKFNTDSVTVSKILSIKPHFIIDYNKDGTLDEVDVHDDHNPRDSMNLIDLTHLQLEVAVTDPMVFDKLRDGIVYFLKHDPYLVASNKARMDDLKEKIEMIDREILKLDSLQNTMYFREGNMPNLQLGNAQIKLEASKQLFYNDKINLLEQKKYLKLDYDTHGEIITIISDFAPGVKPENKGLFTMTKRSIMMFVFTYSIALLVFGIKKGLKNYAPEHIE